MSSLGDLAEQMAQQLITETSAPVVEASTITEEAALEASNNLFTKIRFTWRPEERAMLDGIECGSDRVFQELFADAIDEVDSFFAALWVPETDPNTGIARRDVNGRLVWRRNSDGKPLEDWDQLTGQDVEQVLMNLERVKLEIVPRINQLFLEALFARHSASDAYDDAWTSVMEGTQGDRTARSNRESRQDRYHAYFRYYIWSMSNVFLQEITMFMRRLEKVRDWQTWGKGRS